MRVRRAFTLVELVIIVLAIALVGSLFLMSTKKRTGCQLGMRDDLQLRCLSQAVQSQASSHGGRFAFPSDLDKSNATLDCAAAEKDTTANILSSLIFASVLTPDICVSPLEINQNIGVCADYRYEISAPGAPDPLWDTRFTADFTAGPSHVSYACLQPAGSRRNVWSSGDSHAVLWGNRGPEITSVDHAPDGSATPHWKSDKSNAFLMQDGPGRWKGNLAFADGHVEQVSGLVRSRRDIGWRGWGAYNRSYGAGSSRTPDVWHYDEPDDAEGSANTYLGIFVKAGKTPGEFRAIWD